MGKVVYKNNQPMLRLQTQQNQIGQGGHGGQGSVNFGSDAMADMVSSMSPQTKSGGKKMGSYGSVIGKESKVSKRWPPVKTSSKKKKKKEKKQNVGPPPPPPKGMWDDDD